MRLLTRGIECAPLGEPSGRPATPIVLRRRIVTRARLLEHELISALRADDAGVAEVAERWTDKELGWTARLADVLRGSPDSSEEGVIALALVLACEYNVQRVRSELAAWSRASGGSEWIRQLARLASASLAVQAGDSVSAWPDKMERLIGMPGGDFRVPARMLATGGRAMIDAFEQADGADSGAADALIEAARAEALRRVQP